MNKILFFFLMFSQVFLSNSISSLCYYDYYTTYGKTNRYFNSETCYNSGYVVAIHAEHEKTFHIEITSYYCSLKVWYYQSENEYNFDEFPANSDYLFDVPYHSYNSKTKKFPYSTRFIYLGIYTDYKGDISFDVYAYITSILATWIIIIIVIGGIIVLALISMGIAKCMGRSAWEGLACFAICCALCCCKR